MGVGVTIWPFRPRVEEPAEDLRFALAFEEAKRLITGQERGLVELQTRASVLLSAATLITAFLGGAALRDGDQPIGGGGIVAIVLFVVFLMPVGYIYWPRRAMWLFKFSPRQIIGEYIDEANFTIDELRRDLALHFENNYDANQRLIDRMYWAYTIALVLLLAHVLAWLAELGIVGAVIAWISEQIEALRSTR